MSKKQVVEMIEGEEFFKSMDRICSLCCDDLKLTPGQTLAVLEATAESIREAFNISVVDVKAHEFNGENQNWNLH